MNRIFIVFMAILVLLCASCAPKEKGIGFFWKASPETQLFDEAEQAYQKGAYREALPLYQEYLSRFPKAGSAPSALLKIGMIHVYLEHYERAIQTFDRAQGLYPETPYAREAGVGKLAAYYKMGDYQRVTVYAGNVMAQPLAQDQWIRVNLLVGDSYMALKSPPEAYRAYLGAFLKATSDDEKKKVLSRLKNVISLMEPSDLTTELDRLDGRSPAGYLLFQLGVDYMEKGLSDDAMVKFLSFLEKYPGHEYAGQAKKFLSDLEASALTDRHLIGCLLPISGKYEKIGKEALEGIEFALARFSRDRAMPSLRILVEDTASDPLQAQKGLQSLADAGVSAIIGPIATAESIAPQAQALRIPMITLTQKPGVTEAGDYVFRNFLTPRMQINALVDYAVHVQGDTRFAILYPNESYGEIYMNLFWDAVAANGGRVVGVEAYDPGKTDFAEPIQKLAGLYYAIPEDLVEEPVLVPQVFTEGQGTETSAREPEGSDAFSAVDTHNWDEELMASIRMSRLAGGRNADGSPRPIAGFDAVFIPDAPDKAGLILPQLAYYDIDNVHLLGTNLWHSDKLIDMAQRHVQGAVMPEGFFDQSQKEHVRRFVMEFLAIYGHPPEFIQAVAYDTASILFDLASRPDIRFRAQIKNVLMTMPPFSGVTGQTAFDPSGEAVKDIYLLRVKGRRFVEIEKPFPLDRLQY